MFLFYFQAFIILSQIIDIFPKRMLVCQELGINQRQSYILSLCLTIKKFSKLSTKLLEPEVNNLDPAIDQSLVGPWLRKCHQNEILSYLFSVLPLVSWTLNMSEQCMQQFPPTFFRVKTRETAPVSATKYQENVSMQ